MKKYRIKQITTKGGDIYYVPQKRTLCFWFRCTLDYGYAVILPSFDKYDDCKEYIEDRMKKDKSKRLSKTKHVQYITEL